MGDFGQSTSTIASAWYSHCIQNLKNDGSIDTLSISATDYEFEIATLDDLQGGMPEENAEIVTNILNGSDTGKKADIVILNAAAGIFVGGKADSIAEGITIARDVISSGAAMNILRELAAIK